MEMELGLIIVSSDTYTSVLISYGGKWVKSHHLVSVRDDGETVLITKERVSDLLIEITNRWTS